MERPRRRHCDSRFNEHLPKSDTPAEVCGVRMTTHETAPTQSRIWRRMMITAGLVLAAEVMWMGLGHSTGLKTALPIPANPRPPSGPQFSIATVVVPPPTSRPARARAPTSTFP